MKLPFKDGQVDRMFANTDAIPKDGAMARRQPYLQGWRWGFLCGKPPTAKRRKAPTDRHDAPFLFVWEVPLAISRRVRLSSA
ncbi:MAG: hypothetical protein D6720_01485 [Gammaproteobacteria bacterium]|nr:MAG: hypothetical protein D6720_01485 [Gammaproteobacteria bacterium]